MKKNVKQLIYWMKEKEKERKILGKYLKERKKERKTEKTTGMQKEKSAIEIQIIKSFKNHKFGIKTQKEEWKRKEIEKRKKENYWKVCRE